MAMSYFNGNEAPRDFKVSCMDSDAHYTKCVLCYTVKKNFYCTDCIKEGSFVHSSSPFSERFAEKQAKLIRIKANRKHVLDRCEKLMAPKLKKETLQREAKRLRDRLDLLRLAINQRRNNIEEKRKKIIELRNYNNELTVKLPKYQKRVLSVGKMTHVHHMELENKVSTYREQADSLAALRRSRIRQLTKYIFPVYMTYDISESIEDMEFIGDDAEEEPPRKPQLHIVAPWINVDDDYSQIQASLRQNREVSGAPGAGGGSGVWGPATRGVAALALAAQLLALLAWAIDHRLPHTISLNEYCNWRVSAGGVARRARRLSASCAVVCARAGLAPPAPPAPRPPHALSALHELVLAASTDDPVLGRVQWQSAPSEEALGAWGGAAAALGALGDLDADDGDPPEHLNWPELPELEELSSSPPALASSPSPSSSPSPAPAPAPAAAAASSLITSAAASLASMWRVFTK